MFRGVGRFDQLNFTNLHGEASILVLIRLFFLLQTRYLASQIKHTILSKADLPFLEP